MLAAASAYAFLTKSLSIYNATLLSIKGIKKLNNYISTQDFEGVEELSAQFFKGNVSLNSFIATEGIFSNYGHTYKPYTYVPTIPGEATVTEFGGSGQLRTTYETFQPPIESLPPVEFEGQQYKLGFLYPQDFEGFTYEPAFKTVNEALERNVPYVHIPSSAQPVPIIYKSTSAVAGDYVKLRGKLVELPLQPLLDLTHHLQGFSTPFYSRILDLSSLHRKSLCILIDNEDTYIKPSSSFNSKSNLTAVFFVEGHVEGNFESHESFLQALSTTLPTLGHSPIRQMKYAPFNDCSSFLLKGNVRVVYRQPTTVGFYVVVDLVDSGIYKKRIEELSTLVRNTSRNMERYCQSHYGHRWRYHIDFISDKAIAPLIKLNGVLNSNEAANVIQQNNYQDVFEWLS